MSNRNYTIPYFVLVIIALTSLGCSADQSKKDELNLPESVRKLNNVSVYTIPEQPDTVRLQNVRSFEKHYSPPIDIAPIAVDKLDRVFILNREKLAIDVYDSEGNFITQLGRKGRGPGEFHQINWMQILNNHLYVFDKRLKQVQVFSLESLVYVNTIQTLPKNIGQFLQTPFMIHHPIKVINDSTFLYRFEDMSKLRDGRKLIEGKEAVMDISFYLFNTNMHLQPDTVLYQKGRKFANIMVNGSSATVFYEFTRKALFALSDNNRIYAARTQDFLIKVYNLKGKYLKAFYYPYTRASLSDSQIDSVINSSKNSIMQQAMHKYKDKTNLPNTWPALNSMRFDDQNRLWISTIIESQKMYQWWVLDKQGRLLARFRWPRAKPIVAIRNGFIYVVNTNFKMGTYEVMKYKLNFGKR